MTWSLHSTLQATVTCEHGPQVGAVVLRSQKRKRPQSSASSYSIVDYAEGDDGSLDEAVKFDQVEARRATNRADRGATMMMTLRRLPVFQSDMEKRCAAVMSLIVPAPDIVTNADEAIRRMTPQV